MHNTHNGELPGHVRKGEDTEIKGVHASHVLGSPYEAELKASKYPSEPAAAPAKGDAKKEKAAAAPAEEAKEEKKEAAPAEKAAAPAKEEAPKEAAAAPAKEEAKAAEPAKEAAPKEAAAAPAKEEAKPAEAKGLQIDSVMRWEGAPTMQGQESSVQDMTEAAMMSPISEDHLKQMGALVQKFEPVEIEQDENVQVDESNLLQTGQQLKLAAYIKNVESPEDLQLIQFDTQKHREQEEFMSGMVTSSERGKGWLAGYNRKTDADGDGVEDNAEWANDFSKLDKFYIPAVFGTADEIYNTHHGNLPGHRQLEHDIIQSAYADSWALTPQSEWRDSV